MTHIPAGRALNMFSELIDDIAAGSGGRPGLFWDMAHAMPAERILGASMQVDLNVFPGSWRFRDGGSVAGLVEGCSSAGELVASILGSWLRQYASAADEVDPAREGDRVAVAGGLARRVPAAQPVLARLLQREVLPPARDEETLRGLAALACGAID